MSGVIDVAAVAADMSSHSVAAATEAASAHQLIDQLSIKDKSTHTSETDASSPVNTSVDVSSPTASPVSSSSSSDESESRAINSTPTPTSQQVSTSTPTATTDTQVVNAPSTLAPTTSSQSSTASAAVLTIAPVIAPVTNSNAETGELLNGGYKRGGAENDPETGYYDEIEIEDMEYDEATRTFTYPCPCGDKFRITKDDLLDGEDIARCPSCSLLVKVIYDPDDLEEED